MTLGAQIGVSSKVLGEAGPVLDPVPSDAFVFTVTIEGASETVTIPSVLGGTYSGTIDIKTTGGSQVSRETFSAWNDSNLRPVLSTGSYRISIWGTFNKIQSSVALWKTQLRTIENLGDVDWVSMVQGFSGCTNLTSFTAGETDTSAVTAMDGLFMYCSSLTSVDLDGIDLSSLLYIDAIFFRCSSLVTIDLSGVTNFGTPAEYVNFFSDCSSLTTVLWPVVPITYVEYIEFLFDGTSISSASVDAFIIWLSNYYDAADGYCNMKSPTARTSASDGAWSELVNNGWDMFM